MQQAMLSLEPLPLELERALWQARAAAADAPAVARPLLRTWERSLSQGVDEDGAALLEDAVLEAHDLADAEERVEWIWRGAEAVLDDFAALCASRDFVAVLADDRGIVTRSLGGGAFADEAQRLRLIAGAVWGEDLRGTNAIGTALVEGSAVAVHGAAHYARVNKGLCCFAAPIRDHRGEIVSVLDATSYAERSARFDPSVVVTVARAIEEVLRARAYAATAGGIDLVERLMERAAGAAFLVERPGRVVRANARARSMVAGCHVERCVPPWQELEAHAAHGRGPLLWSPDGSDARVVEVSVEPLADSEGGLLALLVFVAAAGGSQSPRGGRRASGDAGPAKAAFAAVVGSDPQLVAARETCARLARSKLPVLLLAETGSGKELFARAIHDASRRAGGPFVAVNCGAIQPELLLSELFGHGPGAFTGAARQGRDGRIAAADGGTLFLDEVAEMSAEAQVALLRVLEDGSYTRVGEDRPRRADIRVVAATCRDLREMVESGAFRRDLFFRIGGACVELPTLRERSDFDELLAVLWAAVRTPAGRALGALGPQVRARLAAHAWPGNVRELKSVLEFLAVMAEDENEVMVEHLPPQVRTVGAGSHGIAEESSGGLPGAPAGSSSGADLRSLQQEALERAVREAGGNVSAAARQLGVARSTVYRLAERFGISLNGST